MYSKEEWPYYWRHTPRGGYGYTQDVPCRIVRRNAKTVTIEALKADGKTVKTLRVRPENVKER